MDLSLCAPTRSHDASACAEAAILTGDGGRYRAGELVVTWKVRGPVAKSGDGKTGNRIANRTEFERARPATTSCTS